MQQAILQPVAALILLTMVVWITMVVRRVGYMIANRIHAQRVATLEQVNSILPEHINRPSNNFKNLFELPVLFYVICLALLATGKVDSVYLVLAWLFVALRAVHSAIQCSVNIVRLRFVAYALSSLVLWIFVLRFALAVLR
jgi:hypothetical protein